MKFLIVILFALTTFAQQKTVYVAYIDSDIDLGLAPYISRVISEAEQNNADAIVFKINTRRYTLTAISFNNFFYQIFVVKSRMV